MLSKPGFFLVLLFLKLEFCETNLVDRELQIYSIYIFFLVSEGGN